MKRAASCFLPCPAKMVRDEKAMRRIAINILKSLFFIRAYLSRQVPADRTCDAGSCEALPARLAGEDQKEHSENINKAHGARSPGLGPDERRQVACQKHAARRHYSPQVVAETHARRADSRREKFGQVDGEAARHSE